MSRIANIVGRKQKRRSHASIGNIPALLALGDQVRAARMGAGMTQEELALVAGVGRELIIQLENGKPGVALGKAQGVLSALGFKLAAVRR